jgi:hypothetical protein
VGERSGRSEEREVRGGLVVEKAVYERGDAAAPDPPQQGWL